MANADVRKAAIILSSLPEDEAAGLLARLDGAEARAVVAEMARRETVAAEERRAVICEFAAGSPGGHPERFAAAAFECLAEVDTETLSVFLAGEHPQTIALVLAHLPAEQGGEILSSLPAELHASVVRRVASMGRIDPAVAGEVAGARAADAEHSGGQRGDARRDLVRGGLAARGRLRNRTERVDEPGP